MSTIVAIGGGDIKKLQTLPIDKEIIRLSGKKSPNVLFIPTASGDSKEYIKNFTSLYSGKLNCSVSVLKLFKFRPPSSEIERLIFTSDIIYVGGGNTLRMMKLWRKIGFDILLMRAYDSGVVMCGVSAGAICWFVYGHSDSLKYSRGEKAAFIKVRGLGLENYILCPHYHKEKRELSFQKMLKKNRRLFGLAVDNNAAVILKNSSIRMVRSISSAKVYKIYYEKNKLNTEELA